MAGWEPDGQVGPGLDAGGEDGVGVDPAQVGVAAGDGVGGVEELAHGGVPGWADQVVGAGGAGGGGVEHEGGQVAGVDVLQGQVSGPGARVGPPRARRLQPPGQAADVLVGAEDEAGAGEQDGPVEGVGGDFPAAFGGGVGGGVVGGSVRVSPR